MVEMDIDAAWARYAKAEEDRLRPMAMFLLKSVILAAQSLPEAARWAWARRIASDAVDGDLRTPVRFPLFREVLLPALVGGIRSGEPGCARWLAGFARFLCQSRECAEELPPGQRTEIGLLRYALRTSPDDALARSRLIDAMRRQLDHSLHELPAGVLYGSNGATVEECVLLQSDLEEFEALVAAHGALADHSERIAECRLHYWAYEAYRARIGEFESYADYLSRPGR